LEEPSPSKVPYTTARFGLESADAHAPFNGERDV